MRTGWSLALVGALVLGGCRRHAEAPAPLSGTNDAGSSVSSTVTDAALPPVTGHALDAFLRFEQRALSLTAEARADAVLARADAGVEQRRRLYDALKRRAAEDTQARAESGLSDAEIDRLERLTQAVLTKRAFARSFDYDGQIRSFTQLRDQLPEASRAQVNATLKELERQRSETLGLALERSRYGSAAVDLVLAREAELAKIEQATLDVLGTGKRDGGR